MQDGLFCFSLGFSRMTILMVAIKNMMMADESGSSL